MTNFSTYFNVFNVFYVWKKFANFNEFYNVQAYKRTEQLLYNLHDYLTVFHGVSICKHCRKKPDTRDFV